MIKKYPWHLIFFFLVVLFLGNIFQKIQYSEPTDNVIWGNPQPNSASKHLVCITPPLKEASSQNEITETIELEKGDILWTVENSKVRNLVDLRRIIRDSASKGKTTLSYYIEKKDPSKLPRSGDIKITITQKYTPLSYYIMVFCAIIAIILALNTLNHNISNRSTITPPSSFYFLNILFAGVLIFSPTGEYDKIDFLFYTLDRISYLLFPAFLLYFSTMHPVKTKLLKKIRPKWLTTAIYIPPALIFLTFSYLIMNNLSDPNVIHLSSVIKKMNSVLSNYFTLYILLSAVFFTVSCSTLILKRTQRRFLIPMAACNLSLVSMVLLSWMHTESSSNPYSLFLFSWSVLPLCIAYFLTPKKITGIDSILKQTISVSSILLFVLGGYFFLGFSFEQNRFMGIFWSLAAILTAGYLFRPIEANILSFFERIFSRGTFNFKKRLRILIQTIRHERDLLSLSENLLELFAQGLNLKKSRLVIRSKKSDFFAFPEKIRVNLTEAFIKELENNQSTVFLSQKEFTNKFPKEQKIFAKDNLQQFMPLKIQNRLTGFIAFSPKQNGQLLTLEDWELLHSISSSLSLSVENASLYTELEKQIDEISLLKDFNENIIENFNSGIVVLSRLNIIQTWNPEMEEKFQIKKSGAINKKIFSVIDSELWKKIYEKKQYAPANLRTDIEIGNQTKSFDISISLLRNNRKKVIGTILVFKDVTDEIMIQNKLITSEKMVSIGLLSAGIAHEINTPLTGISSYCQFILDNPEDEENIELISKIQEQVLRANKITRTLLDFSRNKGETPVPLNIRKTIEKCLSLTNHKFKKKDITLVTDYKSTDNIYGFPTRIQQLFINLIINSIDAMKKNGIIDISTKQDNDNLYVDFKDNGKGISREEMDKIFEPFFTTKAPGKGTGLGLSISYNIVKEHYGDIKVESRISEGTKFTIILPFNSPLKRIEK